MERRLWKKAMGGWAILAILAILNGSARNAYYKPIVGDLEAHQISTLIFIAAVFVFSKLFFRKTEFSSRRDPLTIGTAWLLMTLAFEFVFGHYVFGNSWERLLHDYDLAVGRIWILALLAIFAAPYLVVHSDRIIKD